MLSVMSASTIAAILAELVYQSTSHSGACLSGVEAEIPEPRESNNKILNSKKQLRGKTLAIHYDLVKFYEYLAVSWRNIPYRSWSSDCGVKIRECDQHLSLLLVIPSASMNGVAVAPQPCMSTIPTTKLGTYSRENSHSAIPTEPKGSVPEPRYLCQRVCHTPSVPEPVPAI